MAEVRLPRYVRPKNTKAGVAYYWEPPHWARNGALRQGRPCPVGATALGRDLVVAIKRATVLNDALDTWRRAEETSPLGPIPGTVEWVFGWYQTTNKFKRLSPKTKADYRKLMRAIADLPMRQGTLGQRVAAKLDAEAADKIYERFQERGQRQAAYAMQICRLVWNWAGRYPKVTGITRDNPFAGMALNHRVVVGNRAATREEYNIYRKVARELGFQSMATAAALAFELVQRVSDVFGFEDPADPDAPNTAARDRGIIWQDYQPGETILVRQHKTGKRLCIPLADGAGEGRTLLYPELEEELARLRKDGATGLVVTEERNGLPYKHRRMSQVHRMICDEAKLPKELRFTSFRHGGATELGDAGEADIRSISGHTQINTSLIYNKASQEKARRMALRRREHIGWISGASENADA